MFIPITRKGKYCSRRCASKVKNQSKALDIAPPTKEQIARCNIAVLGSLGVIWDGHTRELWVYCTAEQKLEAQ